MTPLATFCFSFLMVVEGGDKLVVDGGGPTKWGLSMMAARTKRNPDGTLTFDKNADGIMGPKTLAALRESPGKALLSEFNGHRMNFYRRCPDVEVMFLGWATRASGALLLAVEKGKV